MATLRIFPDAGRVESALREAAEREGFVHAGAFATFSELVARLDGAEGLGRRPVGLEVVRMVLFRAARELPPGPFGAWAHQPGFAFAACTLRSELKAGCAGPSELISASELASGKSRERLRWLARLFEQCDAELESQRLADPSDVLRGAIERLGRELPEWLSRFDAVEIEALYDLPPARLALVEALWRRCEREGMDFAMRVPAGFSEGVDAVVDRVFAAFERSASDLAGGGLTKEEPAGAEPWKVLGRSLFSTDATEPPEGVAALLAPFSAASPRAEARAIALRVRAWIAEGVPPERIAVAFRGLGDEVEAVAEALAELGIPTRARRGVPLSRTALGRRALDLPAVVEDGFPADALAHLVSSRRSGDRLSPMRWFSAAGIRDDHLGATENEGAYAARLGALADRLGTTGRAGDAREVRRLRGACERVIRGLSAWPERARLDAHLRVWREAVERLRRNETRARAHEPPGFHGAVSDALSAARLEAEALEGSAWEALQGLAETFAESSKRSGAGPLEVDRATFHALLREVSSEWNLLPPGPRAGTVRICEVRELVGLRLERVALGGLSDGRFPRRSPEAGLLTETERSCVNRAAAREVFRVAAGEGDVRVDHALAEDRYLFFQALAASEGPVAISYPRTGADGREQFPSAFLDELSRRTRVKVDSVPHRTVPSVEAVCSERGLREWAALEGSVRPELRTTEPCVTRAEVASRFSGEAWWREAQRLAEMEDARGRFFADEEMAPGPFTGRVADSEVLARLGARFAFGLEHPVSASALGTLGNCRFAGLARLGLRLRGPDEVGEDLDPRGRGTFWHAFAERLFPRLLEQGLLGRPFAEVPESLLEACLEEAEQDAGRKTHMGHRALRPVSRARAWAMARELLDGPGAVPFGAPTAIEVELPFGEMEAAVSLPAGPGESAVYLRGAIDRVDRLGKGWGVVDYKSGRIPSARKHGEALLESDFQLPIYLHALRSLGRDGATRAAWVSMKQAKVVSLEKALGERDGDATIDSLLATGAADRRSALAAGAPNLANAVHGLLAEARGGDFRPRPIDCGLCEFQPVCRISGTRKVEDE